MGRHLHTISLTDADEERLGQIRKEGNSVMDIFRAGMDTYGAKKVIRTKEDARKVVEEIVEGGGEYGCGCKKVVGRALCPKHSRM